MARIDDYQQARDLAVRELSKETIDAIASRAGFKTEHTDRVKIPFLDRDYHVSHPTFEFKDAQVPETDVPLQEQVLILHYLQGCRPMLRGIWIAYREIQGAGF
jgi:hypothetical protein